MKQWKDWFLKLSEMFYDINDYNVTRFVFAIIIEDPKKMLEDKADFSRGFGKVVPRLRTGPAVGPTNS
ncbi:MAG: hypothetical protein ACOC38_11965 [Promethearchaeia archaeon]